MTDLQQLAAGQPVDREAILMRARAAATECGSCDAGLPMGCTCDPEPRAVIADLLMLLEGPEDGINAATYATPATQPHPATMIGRPASVRT